MSYTIYLDYVNSNQYHKAVFTRGSGNLWTVGIYDGTTLLGSVTMTDLGIFPNRTILSACLHNGIFRRRIDPAPVYEEEVWVDDEADHGGTLFGLRHDNSTPTKFDDFTANQVILGDFHRCYGCRCRCDDEPMCKSLNIEIDATGLGSCLDGISTTLEWEKDATGMEYWSGTLDLGADGAWGVKFLCGNGGPETHLLVITSGPCSSPNGGLPMDPLSGSGTCHPLALRFGPIILANTDGFCWICGSGPSPPNPSVTGEAYFDVTGSCW